MFTRCFERRLHSCTHCWTWYPYAGRAACPYLWHSITAHNRVHSSPKPHCGEIVSACHAKASTIRSICRSSTATTEPMWHTDMTCQTCRSQHCAATLTDCSARLSGAVCRCSKLPLDRKSSAGATPQVKCNAVLCIALFCTLRHVCDRRTCKASPAQITKLSAKPNSSIPC